MKMNIMIFISGKCSSGKDTLVEWLRSDPTIRDNVTTLSFAQGVREELCRLHPEIDRERLRTDYTYKAQFRKEMVEIGDGYRQTMPSIWVDKHFLEVQKICLFEPTKIVCIPDMRYASNDCGDEFQYSKDIAAELGIVTIRVRMKAPLLARLNRMQPQAVSDYMRYASTNASECSLDHVPDSAFDYVITNDTQDIPESAITLRRDVSNLWKRLHER